MSERRMEERKEWMDGRIDVTEIAMSNDDSGREGKKEVKTWKEMAIILFILPILSQPLWTMRSDDTKITNSLKTTSF